MEMKPPKPEGEQGKGTGFVTSTLAAPVTAAEAALRPLSFSDFAGQAKTIERGTVEISGVSKSASSFIQLRNHIDAEFRGAEDVHNLYSNVPIGFAIRLDINRRLPRITAMYLRRQIVQPDRIFAQKNLAGLGDRNDRQFLCRSGHGSRLRNLHFDTRLHGVRRDHENDKQHEDHIDERGHIDLGQRRSAGCFRPVFPPTVIAMPG